jgi:predicted MFS family arabinose efflux permease
MLPGRSMGSVSSTELDAHHPAAVPARRTASPPAGGGSASPATPGPAPAEDRLPLKAVLVMALVGFLLIATETMPAGLLPQIATGMGTSEGLAGQFVSLYALGTVVAAIPAVALTRGMRRKPVFLAAILGFLVASTVTAVSGGLVLSLAARFVAGAFSGLLWGMTAGYARRITPPRYAGRALAIASIGTPVGLAIGTPFGSWLGTTLDWRWSFGTLALLTLVTALLAAALVPDAPGQEAGSRTSLAGILRIPGVAAILAVIVVWMLAHNVLYTYISSYLDDGGLALSVDLALVVFGVAALVGIAITGALIDRTLRPLVLSSIAGFVLAGALLAVGRESVVLVVVAIAVWGVAFGGAAAQLQTAIGIAAGDDADVANSMLGVAFNTAIFAAGVVGAVIVGQLGATALPVVMIALALTASTLALLARRAAFPMRP